MGLEFLDFKLGLLSCESISVGNCLIRFCFDIYLRILTHKHLCTARFYAKNVVSCSRYMHLSIPVLLLESLVKCHRISYGAL
jgi:hypothetical protein